MSEAELCDAATILACKSGWDVYPEVGGWDLLCVWNGTASLSSYWGPVPTGYQVGVEAKLRASFEAVYETLGRNRHPSTDEVAILVPKAGRAFRYVCAELGIGVRILNDFDPLLPVPRARHIAPEKRLPLPPVALQTGGGRPCPKVLSRWRVGALRLCATLRKQGHLTGDDFKAAAIDHRRWLDGLWLRRAGNVGRLARYVAGPRLAVDGPEVGYEATATALATHDAVAEAAE